MSSTEHGRELSMEELKAYELELLVDFDAFCKKHGIRYCLACGTLIGCKRHGGFIPWDDDIDLFLPKEDYFKLCQLINAGESISDHARVAAPRIEVGAPCHMPFAKVYDTRTYVVQDELNESCLRKVDEGVFIDLFPLAGVSDDDAEAKASCDLLDRNWSFIRLATYKLDKASNLISSIARYILCLPVRLRGFSYYLLKREEIVEAMPSIYESNRCIICCEPKYYLDCADFASFELGEFEGHSFPVPGNWDNTLQKLFGDWRQLPPEDQRQPVHNFKAYLRTKEEPR